MGAVGQQVRESRRAVADTFRNEASDASTWPSPVR